VLYAVSIGPLVQFFLPRLTVDLGLDDVDASPSDVAEEGVAVVTPTSALGSTMS